MTPLQIKLLDKLAQVGPSNCHALAKNSIAPFRSYPVDKRTGLDIDESWVVGSMLAHLAKFGYCVKTKSRKWYVTELGIYTLLHQLSKEL